MITNILQRSTVLDQIEKLVLPELKKPLPEDSRRAVGDLPAMDDATWAEAAERLERVLKDERLRSSLAASYDAKRPASAEKAPSLDEVAFFSSTPEVAILQTVLQMYWDKKKPEAVQKTDAATIGASSDRRAPGGAAIVSDRRVLDAFSQTDPRWVASWFAQGIRWFRGRVDFPEHPAPPVDIAADARFVIVGDWGSGLDRAVNVRHRMFDAILAARRRKREVHVIHLGDIYYSGWEHEAQKHFLDLWPVRQGDPNVRSWCLNANHDMFSGGTGYFNKVLADDRFRLQGKSSRFSLIHPKWCILGLDTAYEDHALAGNQAWWVEQQLTVHHAGKKGMLLSHHQLFSAYESQGPKLRAALRGVLDAKRVNAWLWGHEHRLCRYQPFQGVTNGRCIGHGGVPVYQWHDKGDAAPMPKSDDEGPAPLIDEYRDSFTTTFGAERWAKFGFAIADFNADGSVRMSYVAEDAAVDAATREPLPHLTETFN